MKQTIAIVGLACQYPDARTPGDLWENVLAQRRAFRRLPVERLRLEDYFSEDRQAADSLYATQAAVIEGYEFDRLRFRVSSDAYQAADLTHWLALDVAARALDDAGFARGAGLPREGVGVFLGNTLTGEFSRANLLRLRWPYVRRVLEAGLCDEGWTPERRHRFLVQMEQSYKMPFPPIGPESLAGGLSNTIAGRICNHFDLKGGGYTVDGACASSLLAVAHACAALVAGDIDMALAGGVDLSLDPFELVGFAKAGALATQPMRVYDERAAGFWPGEGCGMVVLMRYEDALAQGQRVYALIQGWGISSDGQGGLTRPEVEGQRLALQRAYRRAGFGIETVGYFEGHGTGTSVGDTTELRTLNQIRRATTHPISPAVIGSIKANIGHTKAAAGVAGLIKAALAVQHQILPPTTSCENPHPELQAPHSTLRVTRTGELWPASWPLRAGVSAMGFGGINAHVVLEAAPTTRRHHFTAPEQLLFTSPQDAELFLFRAADLPALQQQIEYLLTFSSRLAWSEVGDLAVHLAQHLKPGPVRAAVIAVNPAELTNRLEDLREKIKSGTRSCLDFHSGLFLFVGETPPRLGFLFPGQASPSHCSGGIWRHRFPFVAELYHPLSSVAADEERATEIAQPAILRASLSGLRVLRQFGLQAEAAVGHSLGELVALGWADALTEEAVLRLATVRGRAMMEHGNPTGRMAAIEASAQVVTKLLNGSSVVIAGLNAPAQTVVAGENKALMDCLAHVQEQGYRATLLPVTRAFHSPLVAACVAPLARQLAEEDFQPLQQSVYSTITGRPLQPNENLRRLLQEQVTAPVQFITAVQQASTELDLWLEVGPGEILSHLVSQFGSVPVCALDAGGHSLQGLWRAIGAAFALGSPVNTEYLTAGRFTRPFSFPWEPRFFANPCESVSWECEAVGATVVDLGILKPEFSSLSRSEVSPSPQEMPPSPLAVLRQLIAERTNFPLTNIRDDDRLLGDLHLNSITVSQLLVTAARTLGLPPPMALTDYSTVTIHTAALALEELARTGGASPAQLEAGVKSWVRSFTEEYVERPRSQFLLQQKSSSLPRPWRLIKSEGCQLAEPLEQAFREVPREGVIVCLPPDPDESHLELLLHGAQAVLEDPDKLCFVLVQQGGGGAAFARTLYQEIPQATVCVVDVPPTATQAAAWVAAEARVATGYTEAHYDVEGIRREPVLRLLPQTTESLLPELPLGAQDVLLVTGGGKGIAAECALEVARQTNVRLVILGRTHPDDDSELTENLCRLTDHSVTFQYYAADITDGAAVRQAISQAEKSFGPITAILHGAGMNRPQLIRSLTAAAFQQTLAPKLQGARNLLAAIDPQKLKLWIAFGSLIAHTGMRGEADYAVANEWLARLTTQWQAQYPHCRCLVLEWSIWSGVGMGERLGRVDLLAQQGITPISPEEGGRQFVEALRHPSRSGSIIITGRFGEVATLKLERPDLPLRRFLEQPKVYYPGIELIAESTLSCETDPYLEDHAFRGERIFPAVLGLEAMAQVALALAATDQLPVFEEVQFHRSVVVPPTGKVMIRLAALQLSPGQIEVVLRSEETAFQIDHFRAKCRWPEATIPLTKLLPPLEAPQKIELVPERDLYEKILFHRGRFRQLRHYYQLRATECLAEIGAPSALPWFGSYLPAILLLGNPDVRDAALHSIQACIPQAILLPVAVERIQIFPAKVPGRRIAHAHEQARKGETFYYDLTITDDRGQVLEIWSGVQLRVIEPSFPQPTWPLALWNVYLERWVNDLLPGYRATLHLETETQPRKGRSDQAFRALLGPYSAVGRRPDGKPDGREGQQVSTAHSGPWTLAVAGSELVGCDLELITPRDPMLWKDLLGPDRFALAEVVAAETSESLQQAATRVWAVSECLKKSGALPQAPLVLTAQQKAQQKEGWVSFSSGPFLAVTFVAHLQEMSPPVVMAVLGLETKGEI